MLAAIAPGPMPDPHGAHRAMLFICLCWWYRTDYPLCGTTWQGIVFLPRFFFPGYSGAGDRRGLLWLYGTGKAVLVPGNKKIELRPRVRFAGFCNRNSGNGKDLAH